jgi:ribosomal protein L37E
VDGRATEQVCDVHLQRCGERLYRIQRWICAATPDPAHVRTRKTAAISERLLAFAKRIAEFSNAPGRRASSGAD